MASAALTRDRVLHYLPRQVKFYSLSYVILKSVLLPNAWASQQHRYLKRGGREPVASKKNDAEASCPKFHRASCQLQNIANFQMKIVSNFMYCSVVKMTLRHKKTCRNKLTLSSGTVVFRLKEKISIFRNCFDQ